MEEQFIPNKIFTGWAVTSGNHLSPAGEKEGPLLALPHAHSHTSVFGAAGARVGWDWHLRSSSAPPNHPHLEGYSSEHIFGVFSAWSLALGAASPNLWALPAHSCAPEPPFQHFLTFPGLFCL